MIFSKPVPTEQMLRRVDQLGDLGTSVITISGGEPLLHPQLDDIIHHMRKRRYRVGADHQRLSADRRPHPAAETGAGLEWLQISIDNVNPDEVSKKSLKVLDRKLQLLAEHADFHVNINSVVGSGVSHPRMRSRSASARWNLVSARPSESSTTAQGRCSP